MAWSLAIAAWCSASIAGAVVIGRAMGRISARDMAAVRWTRAEQRQRGASRAGAMR